MKQGLRNETRGGASSQQGSRSWKERGRGLGKEQAVYESPPKHKEFTQDSPPINQ